MDLYPCSQIVLGYRLITKSDRNIDCPISLDKIYIGDKYTRCKTCKYNFSKKQCDIMYENRLFNCPMCRNNTFGDQLYINNLDPKIVIQFIKNKKIKIVELKKHLQFQSNKPKHHKNFYYGK